MRKLVIFTISLMLLLGSIVNICAIAQESNGTNSKKDKEFVNNKYWAPIIEAYNKGDYFNAIVLINSKMKNGEKNGKGKDVYAVYYLALCYHHLGYLKEAKEEYKKVCSLDSDSDLAFYSKKAMACMDDPNSPACTGKKKEKKPELSELEKAQQDEIKQLRQQVTKLQNELAPKVNPNDDDISRFIKSKQAIHPAAMDRITIERMERKMQEAEYIKKQQEGNNQQINN